MISTGLYSKNISADRSSSAVPVLPGGGLKLPGSFLCAIAEVYGAEVSVRMPAR